MSRQPLTKTGVERLRGELAAKHPPWLLLDVHGVGYELEAPMSTFYQLPALGQPVTLVTHLAIRDDAHVLYGFFLEGERALFRSLLKVSGVGAKMALAILSGMSVDEFARCVQAADSAPSWWLLVRNVQFVDGVAIELDLFPGLHCGFEFGLAEQRW